MQKVHDMHFILQLRDLFRLKEQEISSFITFNYIYKSSAVLIVVETYIKQDTYHFSHSAIPTPRR